MIMHTLPERLEPMGQADHRSGADRVPDSDRFEVVFPADELELRQALAKAMTFLDTLSVPPEGRGMVEVVLAEIANNVIEHAYAGKAPGMIEIRIERRADTLRCVILDEGRPMAGGTAPAGKMQALDVRRADLPEGGFGWLMIRELTENLSYVRIGNRNRLEFTMRPAGPGKNPPAGS